MIKVIIVGLAITAGFCYFNNIGAKELSRKAGTVVNDVIDGFKSGLND